MPWNMSATEEKPHAPLQTLEIYDILQTMKDKTFLLPPAVFMAGLAALVSIWLFSDSAAIIPVFDNHGRSPVELATLPLFALAVPLALFRTPFEGPSARRAILTAALVTVTAMAIVKELDLHNAALAWLYPDCVGADGSLVPGKFFKPNGSALTGTPFKMRVLTNGAVPFGMKAAICFYFAAFFGVFAAGFAYLFPTWLKGVFALDARAWCFGCFGACGLLVQIADRLPSWFSHQGALGSAADGSATPAQALCTVLEEGGEAMLAFFALWTIYLAGKQLKRK